MIDNEIQFITHLDFPDIEFQFDKVYFDYHGVQLYKNEDARKLAKNLAQIAFPNSHITVLNSRIHVMPPGVVLQEHADRRPPDAEHFHVLHFPLKTNNDAYLAFGDQRYHLEKHSLYEFNYTKPHWGANEGDEERIHLFIEVYAYPYDQET